MKYRVLQVSRVIVSVRESAEIVEDILRAGQPVGLDGEGVNLGPKGQLTLVQVSTVGGRVIIFDVQTTPAIMTQGGLQKLLESEHIIKVSPVALNMCVEKLHSILWKLFLSIIKYKDIKVIGSLHLQSLGSF